MDTITTTTEAGAEPGVLDLPPMTADAFAEWEDRQPETELYELHGGKVILMPSEGAEHGEVKVIIARRLGNAIEIAGLDCQVFCGEMNVDVGNDTIFKPDVVVRRGERLPRRATRVYDPLIVVEVLSPSNRPLHQETKLEAYLAVPTLHHYLVVNAEARRIHHYRRVESGDFLMKIHRDEPIALDPPGIVIERLFP